MAIQTHSQSPEFTYKPLTSLSPKPGHTNLEYGEYNPTLCPCVRNTSLNTRKKLTIVFSRRGPPLRPFGITQICKAFSAGKIGEGLARGLNLSRGEYAGIRCRVMSISLCLQDRGHTGDAGRCPPMGGRSARSPGRALNPTDYSNISLPPTQQTDKGNPLFWGL